MKTTEPQALINIGYAMITLPLDKATKVMALLGEARPVNNGWMSGGKPDFLVLSNETIVMTITNREVIDRTTYDLIKEAEAAEAAAAEAAAAKGPE